MKGKNCILVLASLLSVALCAQTYDVLPYEYGFEASESAEQANWALNPGTTIQPNDSIDRWAIGNAIAHEGQQAMYISVDSGLTCSAGSTTNRKVVQFAYRDFHLPAGKYYVTFDWVCPEMVLYAGCVTPFVNLSASVQAQNVLEVLGSADLPNVGRPAVGALNSAQWQNAHFTFNVGKTAAGVVRTARVWFAWVNDSVRTPQTGLSAAIDNIQIMEDKCEIPGAFKGDVQDCDNVTFEWTGSSEAYELQYRPTGDTGRWRNRKVENGMTTITLSRMNEGVYDFRLRGRCYGEDSITGEPDTTYSPYVYLSNFSIYCPELHCINYLDIKDTSWVKCTYGTSHGGYQASVNDPYQNVGCIDYGWQSKNSRHTIVTDTNALDPRTENQLRMVPHGAAASVRLGNWESGSGTEAITYTYDVDGSNAILLVNYAIVLEDPQHSDDEVPRFIIKIKDNMGNPVDPDCGVVDLNSNTQGGTGWTSIGSGYDAVVFKDWTTLGINLAPYIGKQLWISVETFDCFQSGHYGYAYFTMDCMSARLKNSSCGNENGIHVTAPDGFYYDWYAVGAAVHKNTQSIDIMPTDPTNWTCRLTSTEKSGCFFDLEINTAARYPQAQFSMEYAPENCENRYLINNTSYVWTNEDGKRNEHFDEVCDEYEWFFGKPGQEDDTTDPNPGYVSFPKEGGQFTVILKAILDKGGGLCESFDTIVVDVPAIGDTHTIIDTTICEGSYFEFHDRRYFESGVYGYQGRMKTGCYANDTLHLTVAPQTQTMLDTVTICYGDTAWVGDSYRTRDGVIKHTFLNYMGCDSLVILPVHVMPHMLPSIDVQEIDEEHESGSITITLFPEDSITYYMINNTRYETSTELTGLIGGTFYITFYNRIGCTEEEVIRMCAYEVFQRWNDVVSLKNKNERGGGEFIAYQWYDHGEPIEGATRSYYYKHGGFDGTELLFCLVTLPDSTQEESCTFIPMHYDIEGEASVSPTSLPASAPMYITVPAEASVTLYTTMGLPVMSANLPKGTTQVRAPQTRGVYLVSITMDSGIVTERIVVE